MSSSLFKNSSDCLLVFDYGATAAVISADIKNFESTLSKMMKGKKKNKLKQNSRA